ncbi:MAG: hypothetical protein HETSPECPRED_006517, partial [Heterodermia speciosa]
MLVATSSALLMGLGTWIKRIYYGGPNPQHWEYDLKRRALRKIIHPRTSSKKRLQKSQNLLDSGDSLVVTIWYRPLEDAVMRSVSWKTTGHWCIQVGAKYYELLVDKSKKPPTYLGVHSALPFTKEDPKNISKSTYTTLSPTDVDHE